MQNMNKCGVNKFIQDNSGWPWRSLESPGEPWRALKIKSVRIPLKIKIISYMICDMS